MGLFSGAKSTSESVSKSGTAMKWAKAIARPYAEQLVEFGNADQDRVEGLAGQVGGTLPGMLAKFGNNAGVQAAGGYLTDVLGGKYLNGNPHLDAMMARNADDITSRVGAAYGSRGSFGGTAWQQALGKSISDSNIGLMYQNYGDEMGRMGQAASMAPGIAQAEYTGLPEILQAAGVTAELPYTAMNNTANNLGIMFNGSKNKSTQTQTGAGLGASILGGVASGFGSALGNKVL